MKKLVFSTLALLFAHSSYGINTQLGSILERYFAALELSGDASSQSLSFSTLTTNEWRLNSALHPWDSWIDVNATDRSGVSLLAQRMFVSYNSYYPSGGNDFEVWQGKGFTAWADGGLQFARGDWLQLTFAPRVSIAQNLDYPTLPSAVQNPHGYFVATIDWPQRFGSSAYAQISPGESEIRFAYQTVSLGFGTQSIWLGPARFNPLIMGNNAGGFPHLDVSLAPTQISIGTIEAAAIWGMLSESDYFDDIAGNDHRFTALLSLTYAPKWIPGLALGVHRFAQSPWSDINAGSILDPFTAQMSSALGRDNKDQRASVTAEWQFPSVGLETYFEWARNDYSSSWRRIVRAPEHSNAYTIGVQQLIPTTRQGDRLVLFGELTQLVHSRDYYIDLGMSQSGFYHHWVNTQGHTHRGQILGAPIGTGADAQTIGFDWFLPRGMLGARIARTSRNKDFIYGAPGAGPGDVERLNVEMLYELSGAVWLAPAFLLESTVSFAHNINWNYEAGNDVENVRLFVGLTYRP